MYASYWTSDDQAMILVVSPTGEHFYLTLAVPGDPASIGLHVPAELRDAAQNPQDADQFEQFVAVLRSPEAL